MRRTFHDVGEALDLSPKEESQLITLLAEHELRSAENPPELPLVNAQAALQEEMQRRDNEKEKAVAEFLGEARYPRWEDYLQSFGVRGQFQRLRSELAGSPAALREDEAQLLLAALIAENKALSANRTPAVSTGMEGMKERVALWERAEKTTEEYVRRMRLAAAPYLSLPEQIEQFDEILDKRLEEVRSTLNGVRQEAREQRTRARNEKNAR
jgi:hypothetical protein